MAEKTVKIGLLNSTFQLALTNLVEQPLPVKASFLLVQITEETAKHLKTYEEVRQKLILKYGKKDEAGELQLNEEKTQFLLEDEAGFVAEFAELQNLEVTLPELPMSSIENVSLSPVLLKALVNTVLNTEL